MAITPFEILFFAGVLLCILGLQKLGHPASARNGNRLAALGIGLGIFAALFYPLEGSYGNYVWIIVGLLIGSAIGILASKRVQMTDMPQLVSLFNGLGGACAVIISGIQIAQMDASIQAGSSVGNPDYPTYPFYWQCSF